VVTVGRAKFLNSRIYPPVHSICIYNTNTDIDLDIGSAHVHVDALGHTLRRHFLSVETSLDRRLHNVPGTAMSIEYSSAQSSILRQFRVFGTTLHVSGVTFVYILALNRGEEKLWTFSKYRLILRVCTPN